MARLTLSGGGFRATLFHLGVVRHLCETKQLKEVTEIASVSGGSVLAAHLVLHWDDYVDTEKFGRRASEVIALTRHDVRNRVFLQWLMPLVVSGFVIPLIVIMLAAAEAVPMAWAWGLAWLGMLTAVGFFLLGLFARVRALTGQYRRLFGVRRLNELGVQTTAGRKRPTLYIATTSLTTGDLCCFTADGFHWWKSSDSANGHKYFPFPNCEIATAVAASSAFPPAFDPVDLKAKDLGNPNGFPDSMRLTDGGVYDNLGVELLNIHATPGIAPPILSDAERPLGMELHEQYKLLTTRVSRSTDIMMNRISHFQAPAALAAKGVRLQDPLPILLAPPHPDAGEQDFIMKIRTDLDAFTITEIQAIVYQGYAKARQVENLPPAPHVTFTSGALPHVPKAVIGPPDPSRWLPFDEEQLSGRNISELKGSAGRRVWRPLLFAWAAWPVWAFCILPLLAILGYSYFGQTAKPLSINWQDHVYRDGWDDLKLVKRLLTTDKQSFAVRSEPIAKTVPSFLWFVPRRVAPCGVVIPQWPGDQVEIFQVRFHSDAQLDTKQNPTYRQLDTERKPTKDAKDVEIRFEFRDVGRDDILLAIIKPASAPDLTKSDERQKFINKLKLKVEQ